MAQGYTQTYNNNDNPTLKRCTICGGLARQVETCQHCNFTGVEPCPRCHRTCIGTCGQSYGGNSGYGGGSGSGSGWQRSGQQSSGQQGYGSGSGSRR